MFLQRVPVFYNNAATEYSIQIEQPEPNKFWVVALADVQALLPILQQNISGYSGVKSWYVWVDRVVFMSTSYDGIPKYPQYSSMFSSPTSI